MNSSTNSQPSPYYFISYSRQEVTFVDSFARQLEKQGVSTWVDFRNLVPGHKWQNQLDEGVKNAAAILLVVSEASMSSKPVMDELEKSLQAGRRIVMILFESCVLPKKLADLEYVDFTGDFNKALQELKARLGQEQKKMTFSPPRYQIKKTSTFQKINPFYTFGVIFLSFVWGERRLPRGVRRFFFLGLLIVALSFVALIGGITALNPTSETTDQEGTVIALVMFFVFIPAVWNFLRFPWLVRKRAHQAAKLRNVIYGMFMINAVVFLIGVGAVLRIPTVDHDNGTIAFWVAAFDLAVCWYLFRLLTSDGMYRWAGPGGALIRPARPDLAKHLNADQGDTLVAIEHAPQDGAYARELKESIVNAHFKYTEDLQRANIVLTLLSSYQNRSTCDPQNKFVVPILLQSYKDIDDGRPNAFAQVQWIDLRYGKTSMEAVAHLLDEPHNLQRVLGTIPVRTPILPITVGILFSLTTFVFTYALIITFTLLGGALVAGGLSLLDYTSVLMVLWVLAIYLLQRCIQKRRLWLPKSRLKLFYKSRKPRWILFRPSQYSRAWRKVLRFERAINRIMGKIQIPYWAVLAYAVVLAGATTAMTTGLPFVYVPFWLIPLFMLLKDIRFWLPARGTKLT